MTPAAPRSESTSEPGIIILRRRKPSSPYIIASISLIRYLGRRGRAGCGAGCGCWPACLAALALLFAVAVFALWRLNCCLLCLPCRACIAARCFCVTAGQGATSNAIALGVASRRRICLAFPHPAAHGLLSLFRLLSAFLLNAIKRNQAQSCDSQTLLGCTVEVPLPRDPNGHDCR